MISKKDLEMVEEYIDRPDLFVEDTWADYLEHNNFKLDNWAKETMLEVAESNFVAVTGCNDAGKTTVLAFLQWWFLSTRLEPIVPIVSVNLSQLKTGFWTESRRWYDRSAMLQRMFDFQAHSIRHRQHPDTWYSVARTGKPQHDAKSGADPSVPGIQGIHHPHILYGIDEASGVEDPAWESIESSIKEEDNHLVAIGNPLRVSGRMFDIFNKPAFRKLFKTRQVGYKECSHINKKMAEQQIEAYGGESSPIVQVRFFGRFPTRSSDMTLPTYASVLAAMERSAKIDCEAIDILLAAYQVNSEEVQSKYSVEQLEHIKEELEVRNACSDYLPEDLYSTDLEEHIPKVILVAWKKLKLFYFSGPCRLGVDLARYGSSELVYSVRRGWRVVEQVAVHGSPNVDFIWADQIQGRIKEYFRRYPDLEVAIVDATGLTGGMAIVEPLVRDDYSCIEIAFGEAATDPTRYFNKASEMWLDDVAANIDKMILPYDEMLLTQMVTRKYGFTGKTEKQMRVESKESMRARHLPSPDRADSVCLAYAKVEVINELQYEKSATAEIHEPTEDGVFSIL